MKIFFKIDNNLKFIVTNSLKSGAKARLLTNEHKTVKNNGYVFVFPIKRCDRVYFKITCMYLFWTIITLEVY